MTELAVLIVNWNVRELLRACLTSVLTDLAHSNLEAEVWTVDNASSDGSADMVRTQFPQVRLLVSHENLGFAGGNNLALQRMGADGPTRYVLLLNPDTEVLPGALQTLMAFMETHPRAAVAGARLFYGDGTIQHSAFGFPGLWQILFDLYPLPARLHETRLNGRYPREWYKSSKPFTVDHPLGAAMMVRWATIDQVGLLDDAFHMYCEEIDWCMRIKRCGWMIYCVPQAEVVHHAGQSTSQIREASFVNLWRSRRRLYDKHYPWAKKRLAHHMVRIGMRYQTWLARRKEQKGELESGEAASRIRAYASARAHFE